MIENWKAVLTKAWSIRLMILAGIMSGLEVALPYFSDAIPSGLFGAVAGLVSAGAILARLVAQEGLSDG